MDGLILNGLYACSHSALTEDALVLEYIFLKNEVMLVLSSRESVIGMWVMGSMR